MLVRCEPRACLDHVLVGEAQEVAVRVLLLGHGAQPSSEVWGWEVAGGGGGGGWGAGRRLGMAMLDLLLKLGPLL